MSFTQPPIDQDELMALIDGVLDPQRVLQIEQRAQQDAELAETITALRTQSRLLRASVDPVLDEPIPRRLLRAKTHSRYHAQIAAAMVWLTIGASVGSVMSWQYLSRSDPTQAPLSRRNATPDLPRFVHQAAVAYVVFAPEVRHPVEVPSADANALNTWLSKRLQRSMQAPDLSALGFTLIGGRLLPAEINKPAAQFMYENRQGQRITMYLRGMALPTPETAFRFAEQGSVNTFYWVEGDWGYALSGELPRAHLLGIAHTIHRQLSVRAPSRVSALTTPI